MSKSEKTVTLLESPEQKATLALLRRQAEETGNSTLLDIYLKQMEQIGNDELTPPEDLEDEVNRARLFATPDGTDYFDVEILPPTELFRFLTEADVGKMKPGEIATVERQVVDWCTKRYNPPSHLGFYIDFSTAMIETGQAAPFDLWLTRRQWCAAY